MKDLTLNNNLGDPSQLRQCVGYRVFEAAGAPAPRCTLAVVEVNGRTLGTYTNVEPVKKPLLRRWFDDDGGNLYEGAFSDFRPGWVNTFEKKTNESSPDRADLQRVVDALAAPDDEVLEALDAVIDLDRFYDFWALEVLVQHGDGYARSTNNFLIYGVPPSGRFVFLPWGIDVILQDDALWLGEERAPPPATWAQGALAHRLYEVPEGRAAFAAHLRALLDEVWDEAALLEEVARLEALVAPFLAGAPAGERELIATSTEDIRTFIAGRRAVLEQALTELAPWDEPLRDSLCLERLGELTLVLDGAEATAALLWRDAAFDVSGTASELLDGGLLVELDDGEWLVELDAAAHVAGVVREGVVRAGAGRVVHQGPGGAEVAELGGGETSVSDGTVTLHSSLYPPLGAGG